jgi:hypothetical protein
MQDCDTAHTADYSTNILNEVIVDMKFADWGATKSPGLKSYDLSMDKPKKQSVVKQFPQLMNLTKIFVSQLLMLRSTNSN